MTHLDTELQYLKANISEMWHLVISQLDKSREALNNFDKGLVNEIKVNEKMVDTYELKIDKDCENILALYNPVAVDLRFVLASLKINYNLERVGDYTYGIAKLIDDMDSPLDKGLGESTRVFEMFDICREILCNTLESFEKENNILARDIFRREESLNQFNKDAKKLITDYMITNPKDIYSAMNTMSLIRKLERVGDHVQNIAEEIIFYMEAKVLKHKSAKKKPE